MEKVDFYTRKKKIGNVEYTAQYNGILPALQAEDECYIDGTQTTSVVKRAKYILEHVIVEPKCTIEDFNSTQELAEVVKFGYGVMNGSFRDEQPATNKSTKK